MTLHVRELSYLIEGAKLEKKLKREEVLERQMNILMWGNRNSGKIETGIPVGGNHLTSA